MSNLVSPDVKRTRNSLRSANFGLFTKKKPRMPKIFCFCVNIAQSGIIFRKKWRFSYRIPLRLRRYHNRDFRRIANFSVCTVLRSNIEILIPDYIDRVVRREARYWTPFGSLPAAAGVVDRLKSKKFFIKSNNFYFCFCILNLCVSWTTPPKIFICALFYAHFYASTNEGDACAKIVLIGLVENKSYKIRHLTSADALFNAFHQFLSF